MEGVTIVVILVLLLLLSAGAAAWLLRKKDNAPVDKAVRVPAGSTTRAATVPMKPVPAIPAPIPAPQVDAPLVKPPGIAESPTPKPVIMKSIARRPIEQKVVPKPKVIAPMPRPNEPVIAPMPRPNKPVIAPNMPAFPKTAVQPFVKPVSKCAPDDPTKFDYVRRANVGGKWVCPAGTVDTGCTWADGTVNGERQCRKPKAPKPPANVIVNTVGGVAKKVGGGAVGFFKGLFS